MKRVQKAMDTHDSNLDVVKAREEYAAALTEVSRLERLASARDRSSRVVIRTPTSAPFSPDPGRGRADWPWHDEEGVCGEHKAFPDVDDWEFVAQVNLRQVHASSSLLPEGLLPERGILYFFLDRDFDTMDDDGQGVSGQVLSRLVGLAAVAGRKPGRLRRGGAPANEPAKVPEDGTYAIHPGDVPLRRGGACPGRAHDASVHRWTRAYAAGVGGVGGVGPR